MWWWWWVWIAIIFFLLFLPLTYGWGRGRCGPPYPRYYYRRRYSTRGGSAIAPGSAAVNPPDLPETAMGGRTMVETRPPEGRQYPYSGWTLIADVFWLAVLGAIAWAIYLGLT